MRYIGSRLTHLLTYSYKLLGATLCAAEGVKYCRQKLSVMSLLQSGTLSHTRH